MYSKKVFCSVLSVFMAVLMILLSLTLPVSALSLSAANSQDKIDATLKEKIATASPDEKIPVAIWYEDVDQNKIDTLTAKEVGFSEEEIDVDYEMPSTELLTSLKAEEAGAVDEMQAYLQRTERQREKERERTDEYIMTRRAFSREKYNEKSAKIVKDINLEENDIVFKSQYAPMIIAELNSEQIEDVNHQLFIDQIYFLEESQTNEFELSVASTNEPNVDYETQVDIIKKTVSHDKVTDNLASNNTPINGNGIMVGVIEAGGQTIEDSELSNVDVYHVGDVYYSSNHITEVAKRVAGATSGFANGSSICCTNTDYDNMESLLNFRDENGNFVKVINISHGAGYVDGTIAYMTLDRWINHVVAEHSVTVVAAAHNKGATTGTITSPGLAHNVITVGAYHPGPDYLTYTYDTTDDRMAQASSYNNADCVSKPDVVMPGGSTSYATPMIAGSIALMLQLKPSLAMYPQAVKAIVLASCHRKVLSYTGEVEETMQQGITDKQGAGAPDIWIMARIVSEGTYGIGRIRGTSTQGIRRFVMPGNDASNINISITWLKEDKFAEGEDHDDSDNLDIDEDDVDLDLSVYRNGTLLEPKNLANSTTEMVYYSLDSTNTNYEIRINKETTSYSDVVRYGYAYSTDASYMTPITEEGIYYIRNYYSDKYLTLDTETNEAVMENFTGNDNQKWIIRGSDDDYEIYPAYGTVAGKLNFGTQVGTNPYYKAVLGTEDLNLEMKSWETDTTLEPDAFVFTSTSGGSNNILSYTYSNGIFVRSETDPVINSYRMWVLEDINFRRGDANMDGRLTQHDATLIQRYLAMHEGVELNNQQLFLADANRDGQVTLNDATHIGKILADLIIF